MGAGASRSTAEPGSSPRAGAPSLAALGSAVAYMQHTAAGPVARLRTQIRHPPTRSTAGGRRADRRALAAVTASSSCVVDGAPGGRRRQTAASWSSAAPARWCRAGDARRTSRSCSSTPLLTSRRGLDRPPRRHRPQLPISRSTPCPRPPTALRGAPHFKGGAGTCTRLTWGLAPSTVTYVRSTSALRRARRRRLRAGGGRGRSRGWRTRRVSRGRAELVAVVEGCRPRWGEVVLGLSVGAPAVADPVRVSAFVARVRLQCTRKRTPCSDRV
jgi:hypothetical protein